MPVPNSDLGMVLARLYVLHTDVLVRVAIWMADQVHAAHIPGTSDLRCRYCCQASQRMRADS